MRQRAPKLDKHVDKDVVLCSTTNRRVSNHTTDILLHQELEADPFLQTRGISRCGSDLCLFDQPQSVRQGETQYFAVGSYGSQSFAFKCDIGLVGIGADYVTTCIL